MQTIAANCNVYATDNIKEDLKRLISNYDSKQIYLLTDEGSQANCSYALQGIDSITPEHTLTIKQGDTAKNVATATEVWNFLSNHQAKRKALLINLAGGMPCDLGGFCASTFKRGIHFINIPTTLLAQVDASIGGKTGINLGGLKNEIGVFSIPDAVIVDNKFLTTLDKDNLLSGFAEMLKHALIRDIDSLEDLMSIDFDNPDFAKIKELVIRSIQTKNYFVTTDPKEQNIRKALNFGHTVGHAFETFAMLNNRPILHGKAVAYGMICELFISCKKEGLSRDFAERICNYIIQLYGHFEIDHTNFDQLLELMTHDKKNDSDAINFTLIPRAGDIAINKYATKKEIIESLEYFTELQ